MKEIYNYRVNWMKWLTVTVSAVLVFTFAIITCSHAKESSVIIECAEDIIQSTEDEDEKAWALYSLAEYYVNIGQSRRAYKYLEMIDDSMTRAEMQRNIVAAQVSSGHNYKEALAMAKHIRCYYEKSFALQIVANGYAKDNNNEKSIGIVENECKCR